MAGWWRMVHSRRMLFSRKEPPCCVAGQWQQCSGHGSSALEALLAMQWQHWWQCMASSAGNALAVHGQLHQQCSGRIASNAAAALAAVQ
jgi:hypothetical protein